MADVLSVQRPAPAPNEDMMDRDVVTTYRDVCAEIGVVNPEIVISKALTAMGYGRPAA